MATRDYEFITSVETANLPSTASSFSIANNTGPSNVTGLLFDKTVSRSFRVDFQIYRSATAKQYERGVLLGITDGTDWYISSVGSVGDAGVVFTITSAGQVQYTSDNMSGSYDTANSVMKFSYAAMEI